MRKLWIGLGVFLLIVAGALAALWLLRKLLVPRGRGVEFYLPRVDKHFYLPRARSSPRKPARLEESCWRGGGLLH